MRYAATFGALGVVLAPLAARLAGEAEGPWWVLAAGEAYVSVCFLTLASAYALRAAGLPVERTLARPGRARPVRWVLLPYTAFAGLIMRLLARFGREPLMSEVAPGLFVGRVPFRSECDRLREAGVGAVLNLCWEFPQTPALRGLPELPSANVPILDAAPPTPEQFRDAVEAVARWRSEGRPVLIHCAQGHGRSATVAAAALARLGLAADAPAALGMVRAARPGARPSGPQRAALERFLSAAGSGDS